MSTVHVDQDVSQHLVNAVNKLKTLQHVHVTQELSSHYNYGTEEPYIRDRFRIEMGLKAKDICCQVVLDSSNYYFPPDIIFNPSVIINDVFDIEELSALLPAGNWDLKNESCLYDWFESLVGKLKKPPKSSSLSPPPPPPPPPIMPVKRKKKNWGIFNLEDDSDDDLIIPKEKKADSNDDFIPMEESVRRSRSSNNSNSKGKRPARNQNVEAKENKRQKSLKEIGKSKAYNVIHLDEEMEESSVDFKQATKSSDIEWKGEEESKTKPSHKNPYIDETSTMNFDFDEKPKKTGLKSDKSKADGSMTAEKKKIKNPYIDEASTVHLELDNKPKAGQQFLKNPFINEFEQMEIDTPEVKKPKAIDLMQKKKNLTQGPSREAAMRMQRETKWGDDFMALWRRRFEHIIKMDEKDTGLLTLYMSFKIKKESDQWIRYSKQIKIKVAEFKKAQDMMPTAKVLPPKTVAPMLVKLELISPTRLRVTLISVMNTRELASDEIDSIDLTYDLNHKNSVVSEMNRIKDDIKEQAIHFHLFQTKLVN